MCFDCSAELMQMSDVLLLFMECLSVYLSGSNYLCLSRMTAVACGNERQADTAALLSVPAGPCGTESLRCSHSFWCMVINNCI